MTNEAVIEPSEHVGGVGASVEIDRDGGSIGLGTLVRHWRERASFSQEQLAELAGVSARSVRRLERGISRRPRRSSLRLLAEALELSTDEQSMLIAAADPRDRPAMAGCADADGPASVAPPLRQLLPNVSHFIGRERELAALDDILRDGQATGSQSTLVLIVGGAGMGKTALANRWCSAVVDTFPGGSLYLDLRGFDPRPSLEPAAAVSALLRTLGVTPDQVPEDLSAASAMLRSRTAERRTLMLLDNALDAEQVRPLLPTRDSVAIVTSREQLRGLMVRDATARITLGPLALLDSVALLGRISGWAGSGQVGDAASELVDRCDRVPFAVRILGERLARQAKHESRDSTAELLAELDADQSLDAFRSGDDLYSDLRTSMSWSFEHLDPPTVRLMVSVSVLNPDDDFGSEAASLVSGLSRAEARQHLDRLVSAHLVEQLDHDRYVVRRLIRKYAAALADDQASTGAVDMRLPRFDGQG